MHSTQIAINSIIKQIDDQVWKKVGKNKLQKQLPSQQIKLNQYTLQSFAQMSSQYLQLPTPLTHSIENKKTIIERRNNNKIPSQRIKTQTNTPNFNNSIRNSSIGRSIRISTKNKFYKPLQLKKLSVEQEYDQDIQHIRNKKFFIEENQEREAKAEKQKLLQKLQKKEEMIHKLKQAKESVAYEYDGNLITRVCNFYPNQKVPVLRATPNKDIRMEMDKKVSLTETKILNKALQGKQKDGSAEKNQRISEDMKKASSSKDFIDKFDEDSLSQGVKIRSSEGQIPKSREAKRAKTLKQFTQENKLKKFQKYEFWNNQKSNLNEISRSNIGSIMEKKVGRKAETMQVMIGRQKSDFLSSKLRAYTEQSTKKLNKLAQLKKEKLKNGGTIKIKNDALYTETLV